ncbi:hypothetical protein [Kingella potus]|uniref:hypothetical protein n=1 Tax=Kingella potus TaxID=265175 RepID=UPI001FD53A2F|nr:hypothetical protein [Kingella potus]UOP00785.1 hypothetical protein LVJ84_13685 [Kingella potus]
MPFAVFRRPHVSNDRTPRSVRTERRVCRSGDARVFRVFRRLLAAIRHKPRAWQSHTPYLNGKRSLNPTQRPTGAAPTK